MQEFLCDKSLARAALLIKRLDSQTLENRAHHPTICTLRADGSFVFGHKIQSVTEKGFFQELICVSYTAW